MTSHSATPLELAQPFLQLKNVLKEFDAVRAVDDVSITIDKGEIFALLGSSGCGKSTLLRMLAGFEMPTSGQILLNGRSIVGVPPCDRPVNMMFQSYALFPHLTVWDNIAFGLRREGLPKAEIADRVEKMLELVQLKNYGKRKPHQLSGGQQQRVALARSLAKRPQLLLLDEPLAALDKKLRERTQLELVDIIAQVGVTCVMVTHDQEEAMSMASRIAVMSEGKILQVGLPVDIYETPNCRFVADFIGSVNLFDGVVIEDEADHVVVESPEGKQLVAHGISGTLGMKVTVGIRPEKIMISAEMPAVCNDLANPVNCVSGQVVELAYLGSYTALHLRLATGMVLKAMIINSERHATRQLHYQQTVFAHWDSTAMIVLAQ